MNCELRIMIVISGMKIRNYLIGSEYAIHIRVDTMCIHIMNLICCI